MFKYGYRGGLLLIALALTFAGAISLTPDIKYKTESKVQFAGAAGRAINFLSRLGGGSTEMTNTFYLKGNKLLSGNDEQASLIDLDAERFVYINHKEKTFSVVAFADFMQKMDDMTTEAQETAEASRPESAPDDNEPTTEVKFDFKVDRPGETSTINGFRAERVFMTITMEAQTTEPEKNDQPTHEGTLVIASDLWMSNDLKGHDEVTEFHKRFAEKFGETAVSGTAAQSMGEALQQAFAGDPRIREGLEKAEAEAAKMSGVDVKNTTHVILVGPGHEFNPLLAFGTEKKEEKKSKGGGLGRFAKKLAEQAAGQTSEEPASREEPTQSTLLSITTEMKEYSTSPVQESVFDVPSGYRQVEFGQ